MRTTERDANGRSFFELAMELRRLDTINNLPFDVEAKEADRDIPKNWFCSKDDDPRGVRYRIPRPALPWGWIVGLSVPGFLALAGVGLLYLMVLMAMRN